MNSVPEADSCRLFYIYALVDPRTDEVRYVGQTSKSRTRLREHCNDPKDTHKTRWIRLLRRLGLKPRFRIIEVAGDHNWAERERYWVARYSNLTNSTSGGEGIPGVIRTPDCRRKIAEARKNSPKAKAAAERYRGFKHSEESRRKMSESQKISAPCIAARESRRGVPLKEETKAKIRATLTGRVPPPEEIERMREALLRSERYKASRVAWRERGSEIAAKQWETKRAKGEEFISECMRRMIQTRQEKYPERFIMLEYNGKRQTAREWSAEVGLSPNTVAKRIHAGWDVERAIITPSRKKKK